LRAIADAVPRHWHDAASVHGMSKADASRSDLFWHSGRVGALTLKDALSADL
jgi:hypothetical protein